jgi:hypothetical protein
MTSDANPESPMFSLVIQLELSLCTHLDLGPDQLRRLNVDLAFAIPMFKRRTPIRTFPTFYLVIQL